MLGKELIDKNPFLTTKALSVSGQTINFGAKSTNALVTLLTAFNADDRLTSNFSHIDLRIKNSYIIYYIIIALFYQQKIHILISYCIKKLKTFIVIRNKAAI